MVFLIIVITVIVIIAVSKKDKHNAQEDADALSKLPPFTVNAKPMSSFSKFINLAITNSQLLKSFSYANGSVVIVMQDESAIASPLCDLHVDFDKYQGVTTYKVCSKNKTLDFYYTTNISNKEWDAINSVLCLAGSTRGRGIFSKEYKQLGYVNIALKAIKALS